MREMLRASVWCLFIALALNVAFTQALAPGVLGPGKAAGTTRAWLKIEYLNDAGNCPDCYRPDRTVIYSKKEPVVKKISEKVWTITFLD